MSLLVGVDIGGTKTRVAVSERAEPAGAPTAETVVPSSSWRGALGDPGADAAGLHALIVSTFGPAAQTAALAVGAHGCDSTAQCRELEQELRRRFSGPVLVVNDSELMAPAMGAEHAVGVVVGTGSIATARDADGELITAGGWGWLLGDEASAPGLVRESVRAVLRELDRGAPLDPLGARLMAGFGARDKAELALAATAAASPEAWGDLAPVVFDAAADGSQIADAVILAAGRDIAALVDVVLGRGVRATTAVAGGTVIEQQPRLQDAVRSALAARHPELALQILGRAPVIGAIALARGLGRATATTTLGTEN